MPIPKRPLWSEHLPPEHFALEDLLGVERWMCANCGLIFDYRGTADYGPSPEPGWPILEPKMGPQGPEYDSEGLVKIREFCSRCGISLEDTPPIFVRVSRMDRFEDLLDMISEGEGQRQEWKEAIDDSTTDRIRHTIAAFATSNTGSIIFGVTNEGEPKGLHGMDTPAGEDDFQKRVKGLLGAIRPNVLLRFSFITDEQTGKDFALVTIPKGPERIYYCRGKPYLRDANESRPASPEEVEKLIREHS